MTDQHLVYLFKLAYRQGFITDYTNASCNSQCDDCPADAACSYIGTTSGSNLYTDWLATYQAFKARANFRPSVEAILNQHPEFLL